MLINKEQEDELNRQFIIDNFKAAARAVYIVVSFQTVDRILDEVEAELAEEGKLVW